MKWIIAKVGTMPQSRVLHVHGRLRVGSKIEWSESGEFWRDPDSKRHWIGRLREGTVMAVESWGLVRIDL